MKEKIRIFVCDKCCNTAYTTDGSIPGACTSQYWVRTSGICGGHYTEVEGADFNWVVNQEAEKRIAERMPSEMTLEEAEIAAKETDYACFAVEPEGNEINFADAAAFYLEGWNACRSRLTNPGDSQKTEGGE